MKKVLGAAVVCMICLVVLVSIFFLKRAVYRQCVEDLDQDNLSNTLHECDYITYWNVFRDQGYYWEILKGRMGESDFLD